MNLAAPPTSTLPAAPTVPASRSALAAAVLGWLVPGFGQLYVGRPFKALLMFVSIGGLFYGGLALTGFTCVNPHTYELEFAAHALLGGPTAAAFYLTQGYELSTPLPWFEVGRLYAAVAGLLNLVAICDALGDVLQHNRNVRILAGQRQRYLQEREAERQHALEVAAAHEASLLAAASGEQAATPEDATPEAATQAELPLPGVEREPGAEALSAPLAFELSTGPEVDRSEVEHPSDETPRDGTHRDGTHRDGADRDGADREGGAPA